MKVQVRVFRAGQADGELELSLGEPCVVGRSPDADLRLHDLQASRRHASLTLTDDGLVVEDLGSTSGTRLNGAPLEGSAKPGLPCAVEVGRYWLGIHVVGEGRLDPPGQSVWDEYERGELLGKGGFGRVFAARRWSDAAAVAIKEVDLRGDPNLRQRFLREAKLAKGLDHPNVVAVYDVRLEGETAYQVMELIQGGKDLRDRLDEAPFLPIAEVFAVAEAVAKGLGAIHALGVVHRDIKPPNVLLTNDGQIKIADFGLARPLEAGQTLTKSELGLGSIDYVPPEQLRDAKHAQPAADLYGLGATLYHLLTGGTPFGHVRMQDQLEAISERPPRPLSKLRPDCPEGLAAIVLRLLAKAPADRYPEAAALLEDLAAARRAFEAS